MRTLLTTDGSDASSEVLRFGSQFVGLVDPTLTVLTVIRDERQRKHADAILQKTNEVFKQQFAAVSMKIRVGHIAEEIVREAEEGAYELIAVGARLSPVISKLPIRRSIELDVVQNTPCPVLIVKGAHRKIRRILLCDSGVEDSSSPGRLAVRYADLSESEEEVTILHVMSQISAGPGVQGKQLRVEAEDLMREESPEREVLERNVMILNQPMIRLYPKIRHGFVVDEILDEAKCGDYDLVIIGRHRKEGWRGILLDDLSRKIIMQIDRPVLVVP